MTATVKMKLSDSIFEFWFNFVIFPATGDSRLMQAISNSCYYSIVSPRFESYLVLNSGIGHILGNH